MSVDLTIVPEPPTATKVLFPNTTVLSSFAVGEVTLSKDEPLSVDLTMIPWVKLNIVPTATNTPEPDEEEEEELSVLEVLAVLLSSDFAHEETITAMLTTRTNQ